MRDPDWQLKMMAGNDVHFQHKASAGDPLYVEFWDKIVNNPEETVFANVEEGLDILRQERAVIHIHSGMLKASVMAVLEFHNEAGHPIQNWPKWQDKNYQKCIKSKSGHHFQ